MPEIHAFNSIDAKKWHNLTEPKKKKSKDNPKKIFVAKMENWQVTLVLQHIRVISHNYLHIPDISFQNIAKPSNRVCLLL